MKFDSYTRGARIYPGILNGLPLFVLHYFFLVPKLGAFWDDLIGLKIASDITIPFIFLFALIQFDRFVAKELFEKKLFNNGKDMPTHTFLLHSNQQFSKEYKAKIHNKLKIDFGIAIPSPSEEDMDQSKSKKIISEAVSYIRSKVGKGTLLLQHNTEYGFFRNMAGGAVIAIFFATLNLIIFSFIQPDSTALWISGVLICLYIVYLFSAKKFIRTAAYDYAKILIQEYIVS